MNQKLSNLIATLILVLFVQSLWAQTPAKSTPSKAPTALKSAKKPIYTRKAYRVDTVKNTDFSLNGQYQFMLSRSKTINGYKLINPGRLAGVWQSALDTIKQERKEFKATKLKLSEQDKTIADLRTEISGKENTLNTSNAKMNEISFLGIAFEKSNYHILVWSIIILLGIALIVVILRSTKNIMEARHRTQLYDEITAEYQAFKVKSNEQQRKLARELQDERNIVEELKGRG
ncbi:MAG: hypothetical protein ACQUHE_10290 [Bacteroidia bacterium]